MFQTNETNEAPKLDSAIYTDLSFDSIDQFASWLDAELEMLVSDFTEFETDASTLKFFQRS